MLKNRSNLLGKIQKGERAVRRMCRMLLGREGRCRVVRSVCRMLLGRVGRCRGVQSVCRMLLGREGRCRGVRRVCRSPSPKNPPWGAESVPKPKPEKSAVFARKRFSPPSLDEVALYCAERNNQVNPEKWYDYYSANGWKVGKNSMKDWKAAVRLWENQLNSSAFSSAFSSAISSHDDVQKCADDIERKYGLEARKRFLKGLINSHGVT